MGLSPINTKHVNTVLNDVNTGYQTPLKKEYESNLKSISSDTLLNRIGERPRDDVKIFGMKLRFSTEYKGVLKNLDEYRQMFAEASGANNKTFSKVAVDSMKDTLRSAIQNAADYIDKHDGDPKKEGRVAAMRDTIASLQSELRTLDSVGNARGRFPDHLSFGEVHSLLKLEIKDGINVSDTMTSSSLQDELQPLGSGAINSVFLGKFKVGDEIVERVLKPLEPSKPQNQRVGSEIDAGIDGSRLLVAQRNMASSGVAGLLGVGGLLPMPEVVVLDGQPYLAMHVAKGEDGVGQQLLAGEPYTNAGRSAIRRERPDEIPNNNLVQTGEDEGGPIFAKKVDCARDLPITSDTPNQRTADLQKKLLDLQVVDLLCGQCDRTSRNFMIKVGDNSVTVTGIDNDCSFGSDDTASANFADRWTPGMPWPDLPPVMSKDMHQKIMNLTPETLKNRLEWSGLSDKEISGAQIRLTKLKEHATQLQNDKMVIDDFANWVEPDKENPRNLSQLLTECPTPTYVTQLIMLRDDTMNKFGNTLPLDNSKHQD